MIYHLSMVNNFGPYCEYRDIRIDMALTDYRGETFSRIVSMDEDFNLDWSDWMKSEAEAIEFFEVGRGEVPSWCHELWQRLRLRAECFALRGVDPEAKTAIVFYLKRDDKIHHHVDSPVIAVKYGEQGYYPIHTRCEIEYLNLPGVTPEILDAALAGAMFGWDVPAAEAAKNFALSVK